MRDAEMLATLVSLTDRLTEREARAFGDMLAIGKPLSSVQRTWAEEALSRATAAPAAPAAFVAEPPFAAYCVEPEPPWSPKGCAERLSRRPGFRPDPVGWWEARERAQPTRIALAGPRARDDNE